MAFPISRAVPESNTVPLPTSPVVWAGFARKTFRSCLLLAFLLALAVSMLGFFFPRGVDEVFEDVVHFVPVLLLVVGVVGALALGNGIGRDFRPVLGYGEIKKTSEQAGRTVLPVRGRRLVHAAVLTGLFAGLLAAAAIRASTASWLGFLLLGGCAMLLLYPALRSVKLAGILWRQARTEQRIHRDIVRSGEHSVGTVVAVTNELFTVDNQAMFHVELEYVAGGRTETTRIRFFDYPVWAPAVGSEFDVWSDPARPYVQERILLERRYVGQKFVNLADEPSPGAHISDMDAAREPATTGSLQTDGTMAGSRSALQQMPQWMVDEADSAATPKAARRTRFLIGIPPNLIALLALLGTLLVPSMVADVPWWTLAALWLYTVLAVINAAVYWQFMLRRRWFIRSGISFGATEAAVFTGFFAAGFAMLTTYSMVMGPLNGEIAWTPAHVLSWAAVIGALLVFEWAFTSNSWALKHLNAEFPAPPEAIQEALTGHDPEGIDKLERNYGYRAGVFLCL